MVSVTNADSDDVDIPSDVAIEWLSICTFDKPRCATLCTTKHNEAGKVEVDRKIGVAAIQGHTVAEAHSFFAITRMAHCGPKAQRLTHNFEVSRNQRSQCPTYHAVGGNLSQWTQSRFAKQLSRLCLLLLQAVIVLQRSCKWLEQIWCMVFLQAKSCG